VCSGVAFSAVPSRLYARYRCTTGLIKYIISFTLPYRPAGGDRSRTAACTAATAENGSDSLGLRSWSCRARGVSRGRAVTLITLAVEEMNNTIGVLKTRSFLQSQASEDI